MEHRTRRMGVERVGNCERESSRQSQNQSCDRSDLSLRRRQRPRVEYPATQLSRLLANEAPRDDARTVGRVLSAQILGHHRSGVEEPKPRSISSRWSDPAGDDLYDARAFVGQRLRTDAGAGANRPADWTKIRPWTRGHRRVALRAALEYPTWHRLLPRPNRQIRTHRVRRRGLQCGPRPSGPMEGVVAFGD